MPSRWGAYVEYSGNFNIFIVMPTRRVGRKRIARTFNPVRRHYLIHYYRESTAMSRIQVLVSPVHVLNNLLYPGLGTRKLRIQFHACLAFCYIYKVWCQYTQLKAVTYTTFIVRISSPRPLLNSPIQHGVKLTVHSWIHGLISTKNNSVEISWGELYITFKQLWHEVGRPTLLLYTKVKLNFI